MPKFAFFGSSRFSVIVLSELEKLGLVPSLVVTTSDKPQGRKMVLTPTPVKEWAQTRKILILDQTKLDSNFDGVFVVASYGKIIPQAVLDIPKHGSLNIHPSLLPKYRGASPLQSAMLDDTKDTGITIMQVDADMDHGPIVAQEKIHIDEWPIYEDFEELMAKKGATLLAHILPDWINGKINGKIAGKEQDHSAATFTKKVKKEDGALESADIANSATPDKAYAAFRKIQAFHEWPQAYFFIEHSGKKMRVKITKASWQNRGTDAAKLLIEKVIPEGSKEMTYEDFLRGYKLL